MNRLMVKPMPHKSAIDTSVGRVAGGGEQRGDGEPISDESEHEDDDERREEQQEGRHVTRRLRRLGEDPSRLQEPIEEAAPERDGDGDAEGGGEDREGEGHVGVHRDL